MRRVLGKRGTTTNQGNFVKASETDNETYESRKTFLQCLLWPFPKALLFFHWSSRPRQYCSELRTKNAKQNTKAIHVFGGHIIYSNNSPASMEPSQQPISRRRKLHGALNALARHDHQRKSTGNSVNASSCAKLPEWNGNHAYGYRPSSSVEPNGTAMVPHLHCLIPSSPNNFDYAPPPSCYSSDVVDADQIAEETRSAADQAHHHHRTKHSHALCSAPSSSLPPPPSYDEAMSICSASRASKSSTTRRRASKMDYSKRMSSLKTASTAAMSFNDDDGDGASATAAFKDERNKEIVLFSSSSASYQYKEPIYFTGVLNDRRVSSDQSPSSSRDASPIARRRPHQGSLVSTAHSLASAGSVRAELERIQNIGRDVPSSEASLSSRRTAKPNVTLHRHDNKFRGYSNRRQSASRSIQGSASVGGLSAGLGAGGSVSSLSHLTSSGRISRGSFSSIPRLILKDDNKDDDVSYDPLSYNFVDSDSDVDADDLEDALHTIRMEQLKIDHLKTQIENIYEGKSKLPNHVKNSPSNSDAKTPCSKNTPSDDECQSKDCETSPPLAPLDTTPQYLLAMGPKQQPAKLSPHPSISSSTSSDNGSKKQPSPERERRATSPPTLVEDPIRKGSDISNGGTADMCRLPMRRRGSWTTALGA